MCCILCFFPYHILYESSLQRASLTALSSQITLAALLSRGKQVKMRTLHNSSTQGHNGLKCSFERSGGNMCLFACRTISNLIVTLISKKIFIFNWIRRNMILFFCHYLKIMIVGKSGKTYEITI